MSGSVDTTGIEIDPFADLIERTNSNAGAPLQAQALERLADLKQNDPSGFESVRAKLKLAGCRVTVLDKALKNTDREPSGRGPKQADILVELARSAELFHTEDLTAYADLQIDGHRETWPIRGKGFRRWLAHRFYEHTGGAAGSEAFQAALNVLEANAHFNSPECSVHVRVAGHDGKIYLDLADESWRAVEIDAKGWRVIDAPPVRFRRSSGMRPLPAPVAGGSIHTLRSFLNVKSNDDFVLVVAWLLAALRGGGPYPVMAVSGEQGSAKSTFSAMLRALVDPNTAPLRALPREERDLFIAANNAHVLAFDNVSGLSAWISDTMCRVATGAGFAARQLYTDQDEVLFDAARPIILNGIEDAVTRPDLADRAVLMSLEPIPDERRRPEAEIWTEFDGERPRILGILLDGMARGLHQLPLVKLDRLPRMADFARWASACESAFWPAGTFMAAYAGNRGNAVEEVLDADPVATALRDLMSKRSEWNGTASELLEELGTSAGDRIAGTKGWPTTPPLLSNRIRRAATFLRNIGIDVEFTKEGRTRTRKICVRNTSNLGVQRSAAAATSSPSAPSAVVPDDRPARVLPAEQPPTMEAESADGGVETTRHTVRKGACENKNAGDADNADDQTAHNSNAQETDQKACVQCNGVPDGLEQIHHLNGRRVYLHAECKRFYSVTYAGCVPRTTEQEPTNG